MLLNPNNDVNGHGTNTSSIFGAVTNNSTGIAGVVGGDGAAGTPGVSIYAMKVTDGPGGSNVSTVDVFNAYIQSAFLSPSSGNGYGVHITNHSYTTNLDNDGFMLDAVRWCFNSGITTVASSGNDNSTTINYPASLYDNWVIKVGGNDENGNRWQSLDGIHGSTYGNELDLLAPAANNNNDYISYFTNSITNSGYGNSAEGTSLAAPFVTGAAALIMGYIKMAYPSSQYSEPQDIENLLQFYAEGNSIYSNSKGWGLLNIGNVMEHIRYPKYKVRHFYGAFDNSNSSLVESNVSMTLKYGYETTPYPQNVILPSQEFGIPITYTVDVYRVSGTVIHALDPTEDIIYTPAQHAWALNSQSNMFGPYNLGTNELTPEVDITLSNVTSSSADIEGYTYHIKAASNNMNFNPIWIPFDITNNFGTYAYSLHTEDASISSLEKIKEDFLLEVYPNPSNTEVTVSFYNPKYSDSQIQISDIKGQKVYYKEFQEALGNVKFAIDIKDFQSGIYYIQLVNAQSVKQVKFIVNH